MPYNNSLENAFCRPDEFCNSLLLLETDVNQSLQRRMKGRICQKMKDSKESRHSRWQARTRRIARTPPSWRIAIRSTITIAVLE